MDSAVADVLSVLSEFIPFLVALSGFSVLMAVARFMVWAFKGASDVV